MRVPPATPLAAVVRGDPEARNVVVIAHGYGQDVAEMDELASAVITAYNGAVRVAIPVAPVRDPELDDDSDDDDDESDSDSDSDDDDDDDDDDGGSGTCWYVLSERDFDLVRGWEAPGAGFDAAVDALLAFCRAERARPGVGHVALIGFSQGGQIAGAAALLDVSIDACVLINPAPRATVVAERRAAPDGTQYTKEDFVRFFGGTREWAAAAAEAPRGRRAAAPFLVLSGQGRVGTSDRTAAAKWRQELSRRGAPVCWRESPTRQHQITAGQQKVVGEWLRHIQRGETPEGRWVSSRATAAAATMMVRYRAGTDGAAPAAKRRHVDPSSSCFRGGR